VSIDVGNVRVWDLTTSQQVGHLPGGDLNILTMGTWDPHDTELIAAASGPDIIGYDLRQKNKSFTINRAHGERSLVRDIDFNPNNMYHFVSGGDDSKIKFWDRRKTEKPLKVLSKHSHWVWKVQYHPKYDTFLLSASSDKTVSLFNVRSLAYKNPYLNTAITNAPKRPDKLIKTYLGHEDSVYSVCWSAFDSDKAGNSGNMWDWTIFASLSYDGRVVVNMIPDGEARNVLRGV